MFVTSFSLITLAQSRQSILESMRDSLTAVVTDVVVNMTDIVVASVVVSLSEKKKKTKNYLVSKYSFIRNVFA